MKVETNQPIQTNNKTELFIITIEIDHGVEKSLTIYEGDDPTTVATNFCLHNQLSKEFVSTLADQIKLSLAQYSISKTSPSLIHDIKNDIIPEENSARIDATEGEENISDTEDTHMASHNINIPAEKLTQSTKYFEEIIKLEKQKDINSIKQTSQINAQNIQIHYSIKKNPISANHNTTMTKSKSACRATTASERLYQEALDLLAKRSKNSQLSKKENDEKELIGLTFHPNINAVNT